MLAWLKKHFIPHEENDHRPHILRGSSIRNIVVVIIFLEIITFLLPTLTHLNTAGNMAAILPAVLDDLTNEKRQSQNLAILTVNPVLNKAAEMKAEDMAINGYFAHTSPEGKTPWYWLEQVGYQYQYAGENLAINFSDSKDVTNAWMASLSHKANIVKTDYTEIGTGIATGIYEGHKTIFVVQIYANPLPVVLGASIENTSIKPTPQPNFWQRLFASPRNTTNILLYIFFGIITLVLLLYIIFIKAKNHHLDLITNGLIVLAILGAVFITNYYLSHRSMVITQSLDYSNENL